MKQIYRTLVLFVVMMALSAPLKAQTVPIIDVVNGGGYLIGGLYNGKWLDSDVFSKYVKGNEKYKFYSLVGYLGEGTGKDVEEDGPGLWVDIPKAPKQEDCVAVRTSWNAMPRKPKIQSNEQKVYKEAVAAELGKLGIQNPDVRITQNIRVDLEGDGQNEVIISASRLPPSLIDKSRKGDYTIVMLRKIIHGKIETFVLVSEVYTQSGEIPTLCNVRAVLDLDGDKVQEIINSCVYYEGGGLNIHKVKNGAVTKVLGGGWGS